MSNEAGESYEERQCQERLNEVFNDPLARTSAVTMITALRLFSIAATVLKAQLASVGDEDPEQTARWMMRGAPPKQLGVMSFSVDRILSDLELVPMYIQLLADAKMRVQVPGMEPWSIKEDIEDVDREPHEHRTKRSIFDRATGSPDAPVDPIGELPAGDPRPDVEGAAIRDAGAGEDSGS